MRGGANGVFSACPRVCASVLLSPTPIPLPFPPLPHPPAHVILLPLADLQSLTRIPPPCPGAATSLKPPTQGWSVARSVPPSTGLPLMAAAITVIILPQLPLFTANDNCQSQGEKGGWWRYLCFGVNGQSPVFIRILSAYTNTPASPGAGAHLHVNWPRLHKYKASLRYEYANKGVPAGR